MTLVGTVTETWLYPVKSLQGAPVDSLTFTLRGAVGDRRLGLVDVGRQRLMSAKGTKVLLEASVTDEHVRLPDGTLVAFGAADCDERLSEWLGTTVELREPIPDERLSYWMTFDPPDDDAEHYEIPAPWPGTFVDLAPAHLVHQRTLTGCAEARPDLDWSVRRFRPNIVIDGPLDAPFGEQSWAGSRVRFGSGDGALELKVEAPTVRCSMPLRAQPGGIERQPEIFRALNELNTEMPNHLGLYLSVAQPGVVRPGDEVTLLEAIA